MKSAKMSTIVVLALGLVVWLVPKVEAEPMGTAWTYQGRLIDSNSTADGEYDFQFKLYDDPNVILGNQVGSDVNIPDLDVIDGQFTVELDFGSDVFDGNAVWLEIGVRPGDQNDPNAYTTLEPRIEMTPVPYALQTRGIFVDNTGNVGIGTTSPAYKLDIRGSTISSVANFENTKANGWAIRAVSGSTGYGVYGQSNGGIGLYGGASGGTGMGVRGYATSAGGVGIYGDAINGAYAGIFMNGNVGIGTDSPGEKLEVSGNVKVIGTGNGIVFPDGTKQTTATSGNGGGVPKGAIIMWSGSLTNIPGGWALCDGSNGTPDLRDRFILGVAAGENPGATGGNHNYTLNESQLPSHNHAFTTNTAGSHSHSASCSYADPHRHTVGDNIKGGYSKGDSNGSPHFARYEYEDTTSYAGYHSHSISIYSGGNHSHSGTTDNTGANTPFDNRPAYYKLAFIIKL